MDSGKTNESAAKPLPPVRYFRAGGFNQICLETADDLRLIDGLDETLWVASSCPVKGLAIDEATLQLIDSDSDGRIRPPEMKAAVRWLWDALAEPDSLVEGRDWIVLEQINETSETGVRIKQSANRILENLGKPGEMKIALADALDRTGIFSKVKSNGDGVIPEEAAEKDETKQVIREIIKALGGVADRSGDLGVTADKVNTFYSAAQDFLSWWVLGYPADEVHLPGYVPPVVEESADLSLEEAIDESVKAEAAVEAQATEPKPAPGKPERDPGIFPLGAETPTAFGALAAVRVKVDEFFAQRRVAAFDARAVTFFNFRESDLQEAGKRDEASVREVMLGLPIAHIAAEVDLPLGDGVNPVYADAVTALKTRVVGPLLGDQKTTLSPEDWAGIKTKFAAYEAWIAAKKGTAVESLGAARLGAILKGPEKDAIQALIQLDAALAGEIKAIEEVEKLIRYHRDLFRLLNNTVSLPEFYDTSKQAIFQTGMLVIDGCGLHLCVEVLDMKTHPVIAQKSGIYLIYLEARRKDQPKPIDLCAAVTSRSAGRLSVGKNGIFYDRKGLDWDARVTKVITNPISLREAAWAPFKAIGDLISSQIEKITASRQKSIEQQISGSITEMDKNVSASPPKTTAPAPESKSSGFGMGGMLAGGGVAIAALSSSFAYIAQQVKNLPDIYFLYTALLIVFFVVGPSVLLGFFKLRARDVGMLLEASGWAINGRMRLDLKLASDLTHVGRFSEATRVHYAYLTEDGRTRRRRFWILFVLISAMLAFACWWLTNH